MKRKLVIFDMDGTLTLPLLDFDGIRRALGLPEKSGILEGIAAMEEGRRAVAEALLDQHEMDAARRCELQPGARDTLQALAEDGIAAALLTRNSRACAAAVLERHGLAFKHVATRENGPHKPHPESILQVLRGCGATPAEAVMVGDYLFDLQAAAAAGVQSVLLCTGKLPGWGRQATWRIERLPQLLPIVRGEIAPAAPSAA